MRRSHRRTARGPASAVAARVLRGGRVLTATFGYLFAVYSFIQPVGYRGTYPARRTAWRSPATSAATPGCACSTASRTAC